ncbi:uncharacterized protein LOC105231126 [Bactrocera dorsalis]|uniref:Uncharacterized protein LOC105231126 n=1 Tax=Bactrocera dorsalis TaxID=27457 RepID=A0A6J0RJW3_BACDO|nr:uncharacterized protein LOC105231126 [Bactrocera dorsalis]
MHACMRVWHMCVRNVNTDLADFDYETAIYYGDSNVNIGEPFSITCIVPLAEPIFWLKDGEPITRHNLRHGRDEHSYTLSESAIEGEKHKIEAHLSVRHALKVHEGQYKCNNLHTSYHMLHVRSANEAPTHPQTYTPFVVTAGGVGVGGGDGDGGGHLSTLSAYETIHDLTPSSADDIFTRIWEPHMEVDVSPAMPLPTQTTTTTTHRRQHHHHHQQQQQQQQQQRPQPKTTKLDEQHKLIYINATNFDGNPSLTLPDSSSEGASIGSELDTGLINLEYITPPKKYGEITTAPSRGYGGSGGGVGANAKYPPMPNFPPPRTTMLSTTVAPVAQFFTPPHHHLEHHGHGITASNSNSNNMYNNPLTTHGYQLVETQSTFPLQTAAPNYQQPTQMFTPQQIGSSGVQTLTPMDVYQQQQQQQQRNQLQTYPPHQFVNQQQQQQRHPISGVTAVTAGGGGMSLPTALSPQPTRMAQVPIRKDTEFLVPNYDNAEHQLKVYEIRSPLVLSCNITKAGDYVLKWEKNGTDVAKVKELAGRYRIIAAERKFIIDRTDVADDGLYSCVADDQKKEINVVARVVVRVPSNTGVVEGEKLSIVCTSVGTDPQLSWMIGNLTISNSTGRYILKPDDNQVKNAILSVENISLDDRGEYKCIGRNDANEYAGYADASDASFVRVKGKLAALWPFLGICAEVLILCAIILIYEKRRNKSELEESDTDPQDQ